jgi:bifunctional oligoribonuclease and PAP phosphatase NrnA
VNRLHARQAIEKAGHIVLATHVRPDGDALGSTLGLADILSMIGKKVLCYFEEPIPSQYSFLQTEVPITTDWNTVQSFVATAGEDIIGISLDCGDLARLGKHAEKLRKIEPFLVIDHHQSSGFGDLHWVEPHRSSTGEMVYDLAEDLGLARRISSQAATCLYTALVTDTGSFQYQSTSSHTFTVAARLVEQGASPAVISGYLYDNTSFSRLQLTQLVLGTLQTFFEDQVAVIQVSQKMLQSTCASEEDCEGMINFPRAVRNVRIAIFIKEKKNGEISVSMRSKGDCDMAVAAGHFGGGGHRNASGFRLTGYGMEQVRDMLLPVLAETLKNAGAT